MKRTALSFIVISNALFYLALQVDAARPNILYVYVDDMGWGSIGPNGQFDRKAAGKPYLITPTLDRLASEGVNFRRGYGCTVCSPARSSQQTGFHQGHTFADQNNPDNAMKAIRADDKTIGDVLSEAGYVTGYWGKWGYGGSRSQPNPEILNVQTLPTSHGYQHVLAELHHVRAHTFFQPTLWKAPAVPGALGGLELVPNSMKRYLGNKSYPASPSLHDHPDYPETAYCDDLYAFAALDFVRIQSQNYNSTGQPFFGLLAVQVPHAPFAEINQLPEWDQAYRKLSFWNSLSDQAKHWAAMITRIDGHIGNILAALEDPNGDGDRSDSVAGDTLVIFQSDNGGPRHPAKDEFDANGGLREVKGRIQEGGIRVPLMMRLPSNFAEGSSLRPGTNSDLVFDVTDMLPTFCDLAGVSAPLGIDGVSLAPTLSGQGRQKIREFVIHEAGNGQSIIRGDYKLIRNKSGLELYNLKKDPAEENNLANKHPGLVKELETLLLGERVNEPKGFSNTYHRWIGASAGSAADAENWSDYVYANAGITYTTDNGAPHLAWTAFIENTDASDSTVVADSDLEFLALEIGGISARQSLVLDPYVKLTGRNEIRISDNGSLIINQGTVSSLRWIDIRSGGSLKGNGVVDSAVYNGGEVAVLGGIRLKNDYFGLNESSLRLALSDQKTVPLIVDGKVSLSGELQIEPGPRFKAKKGETITIIEAQKLSGRFSNPDGVVDVGNGMRFSVNYSGTEVQLRVL